MEASTGAVPVDVFKEVCKHPKLSRQPANNPGPSGIFIVASALCIVADSNPEAEYEETLAKAAGFLAALNFAEVGVQALACLDDQAEA